MEFHTRSDEEARLLLQVLESALGDTRTEANKTENRQMRQDLKHDQEILEGMIARLRHVGAPA